MVGFVIKISVISQASPGTVHCALVELFAKCENRHPAFNTAANSVRCETHPSLRPGGDVVNPAFKSLTVNNAHLSSVDGSLENCSVKTIGSN